MFVKRECVCVIVWEGAYVCVCERERDKESYSAVCVIERETNKKKGKRLIIRVTLCPRSLDSIHLVTYHIFL